MVLDVGDHHPAVPGAGREGGGVEIWADPEGHRAGGGLIAEERPAAGKLDVVGLAVEEEGFQVGARAGDDLLRGGVE